MTLDGIFTSRPGHGGRKIEVEPYYTPHNVTSDPSGGRSAAHSISLLLKVNSPIQGVPELPGNIPSLVPDYRDI